jgi:DNA mismatch repair protein MutS
VEEAGATATPLARASFDSTLAEGRDRGGVRGGLDGGVRELRAGGGRGARALVDYLELTQKGRTPVAAPADAGDAGGLMAIDAATRRNLELTRSLSGGREGALLAVVDRTLTGAGGRLLEARLSAPSTDVRLIRARQAAVAHFVEDTEGDAGGARAAARTPDLERALSRLALDRGGSRDLAAIRDGLAQAARLRDALRGDLPEALAEACAALGGHERLAALLEAALAAEPPAMLRDGGLVAAGYDEELDATRVLRDRGRGVVAELQGSTCGARGSRR